MNKKQIQAQIAMLQARAMGAFKAQNFELEDECDRQIAELKKKLGRIPFVPPVLKEGECREHHWDAALLAQYGNDRCRFCQMQHRYYVEGQAGLSAWTEEEKKAREYSEIVDSYRCKVHRHSQKQAEQRPTPGAE